MFKLEKIENAYLVILRYMIIVVATLALLASGYMVLNGFVKSLTGDPDLPTKSFVNSANNSIPTTDIALSWISDSEKESMEEFITSNKIKGHYTKRMQDEPSLQVLANKFLTNAFDVSYTNEDAVSGMIFGENGVSWDPSYSNTESSRSDNLNTLYLSMLRNHLENLSDLAPWFAQLNNDRREDYQNHLLSDTDGDVQRYLARFNSEWEEWVEDLGYEYDADLAEAEMTRASASMSYYAAGIAFAIFLAVMFMSLIAFIERNTSKIANK
jgi:hypothetical protein